MSFSGRQILLAAAGLVAFIVVSVGAQQVAAIFFDFQPDDVREWIEGFGLWGPLVYMAALVVSIVFSPLPTAALAVAAGLAYGVILGTLYTLAGGITGGVICFLLARRFGRPWLERRVNRGTMDYIDRLALNIGARLLLITRLVPVFGFEWVSYAAGLTRMRLWTFTIWSLLGSILPVLAITYVGDQLDTDPRKSAVVLALLVLVAVGTLVFYAVRRRATVRVLADVGAAHAHERPPEPAGATGPERR